MSLINQVLQDLDTRRAAECAGSGLPNDVRPFHVRRAAKWPLLAAAVVLLALGAGAALWYADAYLTPPPLPAPVTPSAPNVAIVPDPPLVAAAPSEPATAPVARDLPPKPLAENGSERRPTAAVTSKPVTRPPASARAQSAADPGPAVAPAAPSVRAPRSAGGMSIEKSSPSGAVGESADAEYRRAQNILNQGRTSEALDALRMALKLNAMHVAARQLLLKLLIENRRFDEADVVLREGLAQHPEQIAWAMSLARLQLDRGDLVSAGKTLEHSLPAAGGSADYQGFAGHLLQRQGRTKEAVDCYQAATRLAPLEGRWWLGLGLALEAEGRAAQAREAFSNAKASASLSADLQAYVEQKLR